MLEAIEENPLLTIMRLAQSVRLASALIHGRVIMSRRQRSRRPALAREDDVCKLYRRESETHRRYRLS